MGNFKNEKEGQMAFFDNYNIDYVNEPVLVDYTDGVYHGNILEFKLSINDLNKVLFQAIKYLSKMRIKGESIPARILLVDLNADKLYVYDSKDYIDDIQKVYLGASSKYNSSFAKNATAKKVYNYLNQVDSAEVRKILINIVQNATDWYIPIDIDENCILGWANRYYSEVPKASKGDFLGDGTGKINIKGEIREPKHFSGLINPYDKPTNEKFKYLMDCLNDNLSKKDLGAFYTPIPYCEKAAELVKMAVDRVPEGNDYIILDRCAGTGNLEIPLKNIKDNNGDTLLSHCIVSTYEYYEYKVLMERIGADVREIIPPTEANIVYENGKVSNADALSKDYVDNPIIKQYIDNEKCTVILLENPPYSDTFGEIATEDTRDVRKDSYVSKEFKNNFTSDIKGQIPSKDIANLFIWSGFNMYLRQDTDSFIVFSPIKYWKSNHLVNNKFIDGFLFNRKHFHASPSAISCILWSKEIDNNCDKLNLHIYDISDDSIQYIQDLEVKKVYKQFNQYFFDKRTLPSDQNNGVYSKSDGYEGEKLKSTSTENVFGKDILGYLHIIGFTFGMQTLNLTRCTLNVRKNGFNLRQDVYLEKLPLFAAKAYDQDVWYNKDVFFTTADGGNAYIKDKDLIKSCLIYTCLSNQNRCVSFNGSDNRFYRNQLCFDNTNGNTIASSDLNKMTLDSDEQELVKQWDLILSEAIKTKNYDKKLTYGIYQIDKELNTYVEVGTGKNKSRSYDYPILNGYLSTMRELLKKYYKSHIENKLFKYELLK